MMYMSTRRRFRPWIASLTGLVALLSTCGMILAKQHPHLTPIKNSLPPSKIVGIGLNCHGEKLPLAQVKAIGVKWVRLDLAGNLCTAEMIRPLVEYYRDFGQ